MDRRHEAKLKKAPRYRNYRTETKPAPSLDDKDGRKGGENRTRAVQRRSALADLRQTTRGAGYFRIPRDSITLR